MKNDRHSSWKAGFRAALMPLSALLQAPVVGTIYVVLVFVPYQEVIFATQGCSFEILVLGRVLTDKPRRECMSCDIFEPPASD